ncbi:MAG TPA: ATP-binding protein [Acidilobales archaeon]|nr:ATP-binding protein [Acidilobales archaeon]
MPGKYSSILCMPCKFVGRDSELEVLSKSWESRPSFVVIYGRRRVGKTRLIREWLVRSGVKYVYFLAQLSSYGYNLRKFTECASRTLHDVVLSKVRFSSLRDALDYIATRFNDVVVVIDEFTYWIRSSPKVLSEVQGFVDEVLPKTKLMLVICGSLVGLMLREVIGGGAPLYGRATVRLRVRSLRFRDFRELLSGWRIEDVVRAYALVGGIPFYACLASKYPDLISAVRGLIASPGAPLVEEKYILLREEFREPHTYSSILSAIARGYGTPSKISEVTGVDSSHVSKYLRVMEFLDFVKRIVPLFSKKGRYVISDPILRTWYVLIEPVIDLIEIGAYDEVLNHILRELDRYTSVTWEELVRQYLLSKYLKQGFTVAGYLERKGEELDVAILNTNKKEAVVAEVKWSDIDLDELIKLRDKALRKAHALLPKDYVVKDVYLAVKSLGKGEEKPYWVVTPNDLVT